MGNVEFSKEPVKKVENISLRGYYQALPGRTAPKHAFLELICQKCHVTMQTARNWVLYGVRPSLPFYRKVLSEITQINEDDLWKD